MNFNLVLIAALDFTKTNNGWNQYFLNYNKVYDLYIIQRNKTK